MNKPHYLPKLKTDYEKSRRLLTGSKSFAKPKLQIEHDPKFTELISTIRQNFHTGKENCRDIYPELDTKLKKLLIDATKRLNITKLDAPELVMLTTFIMLHVNSCALRNEKAPATQDFSIEEKQPKDIGQPKETDQTDLPAELEDDFQPGIRAVEVTEEDFEAYKRQFSADIATKLDNKLAESTAPHLIKRFLAKYNLPLRDTEAAENNVMLLRSTSEALEWALDSLQARYNMPFSMDALWQLVDSIGYVIYINLQAAFAPLTGNNSTDTDETRAKFFNTSQEITNNLCNYDLKSFSISLETKILKPVSITPHALDILYRKLPLTDEEDTKISELDQKLSQDLGEIYNQNNLLLIATAIDNEYVLRNIELLATASYAFPMRIWDKNDLPFLERESEPAPEFFDLINWLEKHEMHLALSKLDNSYEEYEKYGLKDVPLTEEFAVQLQTAIQNSGGESSILTLIAALANWQGLDRLQAQYGFKMEYNSLDKLISMYLEFQKEFEYEGKKLTIDLSDYQTYAIAKIFLMGARKKFTEESDEINSEKLLDALDIALRKSTFIISTGKQEKLAVLIKLSEAGFIWTELDDDQYGRQFSAIISELAEKPEIFEQILDAHKEMAIFPALSFRELISLYNMSEDSRCFFIDFFMKLGTLMQNYTFMKKDEHAQLIFMLEDDARCLYEILWDKDQNELNSSNVQSLENVQEKFQYQADDFAELCKLAKVAQKLAGKNREFSKIFTLFEKYNQPQDADDFLRSLGIYLGDDTADLTEFVEKTANFKTQSLYDRVLKKYKISGNATNLFYDHVAKTDRTERFRMLLQPEVFAWMQKVTKNFGIPLVTYSDLNSLAYKYEKLDERNFLESKEALDFYQQAKCQGHIYQSYELHEMYEDYQNRDLLPYLDILEKKFRISFKKNRDNGIGALLEMLEQVQTMFFGREITASDYLNALKHGGYLDDLTEERTKTNFDQFKDAFDLNIGKKDFLHFMLLNSRPAYFEKIMRPEFVAFVAEFRETFPDYKMSLIDIDFLLDAYEGGNFFKIFEKLQTEIDSDLTVQDFEDIETVSQLTTNPKLLQAVCSNELKTAWQKIKNHKEEAYLSDIQIIYSLLAEGFDSENLYSEDFSMFLLTALQKKGFGVKERYMMKAYFDDQNIRAKINSEAYRNMLHTLSADDMSPEIIEIVLFFIEHPDLLAPFKEKMKYGGMMFLTQDDENLGDAGIIANSLPSFLLLEKNPEVKAYQELLQKYMPYDTSVADGFALEELTKIYPTPVQFEAVLKIIRQNLTDAGLTDKKSQFKERFPMNDLMIVLRGNASFNYDRLQLEAAVQKQFKDDIHRQDHNFFSYRSYNDLSRWNLFELNKVNNLQRTLDENPELRNQIATQIVRDIEHELTTELGAIVSTDNRFEYHPPHFKLSNGSYFPRQIVYNRLPAENFFSHQHATSYDSSRFASQSGSLFQRGADISNSAITQTDGLVITSLEKRVEKGKTIIKFAVHACNNRKNVMFLGIFEGEPE